MGGKTIDQTYEEILELMEDFILVESDQKIRTKNNAMTSKHHLNYFDMLVHRMKHAFMVFRYNPAIIQADFAIVDIGIQLHFK